MWAISGHWNTAITFLERELKVSSGKSVLSTVFTSQWAPSSFYMDISALCTNSPWNQWFNLLLSPLRIPLKGHWTICSKHICTLSPALNLPANPCLFISPPFSLTQHSFTASRLSSSVSFQLRRSEKLFFNRELNEAVNGSPGKSIAESRASE